MDFSLNRLALLPAVGALLVACANTGSYTWGNQTYRNRDEALAAVARGNADAEAAISSASKTLVDRKIIVVVPTAGALIKAAEAYVTKQGKQFAPPGTPIRSQWDFTVDAQNFNLKSVVSSIRKANIYRETEILDVDSMTANIQPTKSQDVLSFNVSGESGQTTIYFLSERSGKQIVAVDNSSSNLADRRRSLIDDIKAKALQ